MRSTEVFQNQYRRIAVVIPPKEFHDPPSGRRIAAVYPRPRDRLTPHQVGQSLGPLVFVHRFHLPKVECAENTSLIDRKEYQTIMRAMYGYVVRNRNVNLPEHDACVALSYGTEMW